MTAGNRCILEDAGFELLTGTNRNTMAQSVRRRGILTTQPHTPRMSDGSNMTKSALDTLLDAAVLAPSGDNTQPWQFTVDRSTGTIDLRIDPSRDPSPMNAGQRMARIALGAALENMVQTAERNGWPYRIEASPPDALARFTLDGDPPAGTIEATLANRNTNRRVYDARPLPSEVLAKLTVVTGSLGSARSTLITDPAVLTRLVQLVGRADAIMLGTQAIRNAFLANVRFDAAPTAEVDLGLSLGSLEVSTSDRLSLRLMHALPPPDGLMRALGARRIFTRVANKLASSASAICLITKTSPTAPPIKSDEYTELSERPAERSSTASPIAPPIGADLRSEQPKERSSTESSVGDLGSLLATPHSDPQADLDVGRLWQRLWLELTRQQLAGQPMMSLLVLKNVIEKGDPQLFSPRDLTACKSLLDEFHTLSATLLEGDPAVLMRIGTAPAPTSRVRRLPPANSTRFQ